MDQPFIFLFFCGLKGLAALVISMLTRNNAAPGYPHPGHFTHGYGAGLGKKPRHFLVTAPVRAFNGVIEMDFGAVAFAHYGVTQGRLHAAHCR